MMASAVKANAAPIPKESLPCYATTEQATVTENLISGILDEVKNGLGYYFRTAFLSKRNILQNSNNAVWRSRNQKRNVDCRQIYIT